jgi:flagellar biosynthesis/type III secretory pathway protein FliH
VCFVSRDSVLFQLIIMKPLLPYRSYNPDTSLILARLRRAESEFKNRERVVRNRCAELLKRYRQRELQRTRARESQLLTEVLRQTSEWKKSYQVTEERRISEVVRTVVRVFLQNDLESRVSHVVREVRTMVYQHSAHQVIVLRVSPELEAGLKSAFPQIEITVDSELKRGAVVVHTPIGEMEYSWDRQLQLLLDLL